MKIHWLTLDHRSWNSIIGYSILIGYSSSWTTITYTNSNSISWNWLIYFHRTKNIAQFPFLHFLPFLLTVLRKCKRASFRQNIHVIFWNFCNKVCSVKQDTKHSIVLLPRLVSFFTERTLKSGWNDIRPVSIWKNRISVLVVIGPKLLGQDENSKSFFGQFLETWQLVLQYHPWKMKDKWKWTWAPNICKIFSFIRSSNVRTSKVSLRIYKLDRAVLCRVGNRNRPVCYNRHL